MGEMLTRAGSCVTFGLMGAALVPMILLTNAVPDRIPADVVAEEQEAAEKKGGEFQITMTAAT